MAATAAAPVRVLCIDDIEDVAASLADLLAAVGFDARSAIGGRAGLEAAAAFRPHACLIDLRMPGVDGHEVARRMRADFGAAILLVAVTAGWDGPAAAAASGFDGYLVKPVGLGDLLDALAAAGRLTD